MILIGCDPEVFVKKDGKFISAHGLIPGTKENPYSVNSNIAIQVDGMALEFNIKPASSRADFMVRNTDALGVLSRKMKEQQSEIAIVPVANFSQQIMDLAPLEAKLLGCEPDYNAWTGQINPRPCADGLMRTAAGHIHIGWTEGIDPFDEDHFEDCCTVVRQLDYYLGLHSLFWDKDVIRRTLYGQPGAFRPKPYGVEYRVLSNQWLKSDELMVFIYDVSIKAVRELQNGRSLVKEFGDFARECIINNDNQWFRKKKEVHKRMGIHYNPGYPAVENE